MFPHVSSAQKRGNAREPRVSLFLRQSLTFSNFLRSVYAPERQGKTKNDYENYQDLDKTQVKLFPNFTSIPFDYLLISWVTNYVSNLGSLTCLSWIVSIENSTLSNVQTLNLAYKIENVSDFISKIPVRILLDVLFCVFRFSKASFCALTSSFTAF